jgi:polar amino acid transport system substrate-binding protein
MSALRRPGLAILALVPALWAASPARGAEPAPAFRLCADPDNLPFSAENRETPGFYLELGRAIADRLGRAFQPVWERTYFARRAVRTGLLQGRCDGFIGLPDEPDLMGSKLIFSKPILDLGYALALPRGMSIKGLSDLAGHRVAVQFASPPQNLLAARDDVPTVTALSPEEAMRDLAEGQADVAFIWGPSAGWIDKSTLGGAYEIVPVTGPHMQWRAAIGFRSGDAALRDEVDAAIDALAGTAEALEEKYGFPKGRPVTLAQAGEVSPSPVDPPPASASGSTQAAAALPPPTVPPERGDPVAAGHKIFNDNCSHCHGPDAVQGERRRNLRLLYHRYGEEADRVFMTAVTNGRPAKGMPNWSGILSSDQFQKVLAFLHSVQEP